MIEVDAALAPEKVTKRVAELAAALRNSTDGGFLFAALPPGEGPSWLESTARGFASTLSDSLCFVPTELESPAPLETRPGVLVWVPPFSDEAGFCPPEKDIVRVTSHATTVDGRGSQRARSLAKVPWSSARPFFTEVIPEQCTWTIGRDLAAGEVVVHLPGATGRVDLAESACVDNKYACPLQATTAAEEVPKFFKSLVGMLNNATDAKPATLWLGVSDIDALAVGVHLEYNPQASASNCDTDCRKLMAALHSIFPHVPAESVRVTYHPVRNPYFDDEERRVVAFLCTRNGMPGDSMTTLARTFLVAAGGKALVRAVSETGVLLIAPEPFDFDVPAAFSARRISVSAGRRMLAQVAEGFELDADELHIPELFVVRVDLFPPPGTQGSFSIPSKDRTAHSSDWRLWRSRVMVSGRRLEFLTQAALWIRLQSVRGSVPAFGGAHALLASASTTTVIVGHDDSVAQLHHQLQVLSGLPLRMRTHLIGVPRFGGTRESALDPPNGGAGGPAPRASTRRGIDVAASLGASAAEQLRDVYESVWDSPLVVIVDAQLLPWLREHASRVSIGPEPAKLVVAFSNDSLWEFSASESPILSVPAHELCGCITIGRFVEHIAQRAGSPEDAPRLSELCPSDFFSLIRRPEVESAFSVEHFRRWARSGGDPPCWEWIWSGRIAPTVHSREIYAMMKRLLGAEESGVHVCRIRKRTRSGGATTALRIALADLAVDEHVVWIHRVPRSGAERAEVASTLRSLVRRHRRVVLAVDDRDDVLRPSSVDESPVDPRPDFLKALEKELAGLDGCRALVLVVSQDRRITNFYEVSPFLGLEDLEQVAASLRMQWGDSEEVRKALESAVDIARTSEDSDFSEDLDRHIYSFILAASRGEYEPIQSLVRSSREVLSSSSNSVLLKLCKFLALMRLYDHQDVGIPKSCVQACVPAMTPDETKAFSSIVSLVGTSRRFRFSHPVLASLFLGGDRCSIDPPSVEALVDAWAGWSVLRLDIDEYRAIHRRILCDRPNDHPFSLFATVFFPEGSTKLESVFRESLIPSEFADVAMSRHHRTIATKESFWIGSARFNPTSFSRDEHVARSLAFARRAVATASGAISKATLAEALCASAAISGNPAHAAEGVSIFEELAGNPSFTDFNRSRIAF